jgi:hypothetical protein
MELEDAAAEIVHDFSKHGEYSDYMETLAPEEEFKKTFSDRASSLIQ